jgi:hypothetical protein
MCTGLVYLPRAQILSWHLAAGQNQRWGYGEAARKLFLIYPGSCVSHSRFSHWVGPKWMGIIPRNSVNGKWEKELAGSLLSFRPAKKRANNNQKRQRRKTSHLPRFLFPSDVMSLVQQENKWCKGLYSDISKQKKNPQIEMKRVTRRGGFCFDGFRIVLCPYSTPHSSFTCIQLAVQLDYKYTQSMQIYCESRGKHVEALFRSSFLFFFSSCWVRHYNTYCFTFVIPPFIFLFWGFYLLFISFFLFSQNRCKLWWEYREISESLPFREFVWWLIILFQASKHYDMIGGYEV